MYFSVSRKPNIQLPYHRQVGNKWLSTTHDLSLQDKFGYKLGYNGGNYVWFGDKIQFSYHKDFKLVSTDE